MRERIQNGALAGGELLVCLVGHLAGTFLLHRPPAVIPAALLLFLFSFSFWYHRLFTPLLFASRMGYTSLLLNALLVVFLLFAGTWWLLLKSLWPTTSRLLILFTFVLFTLYAFLFRYSLGRFFLSRTPVALLLRPEHRKSFRREYASVFTTVQELKGEEELDRVKRGILLISYRASPGVTSRAEMWGDYLESVKRIKAGVRGKSVRILFFHPENASLVAPVPTILLDDLPALEATPSRRLFYRSIAKPFLDKTLALLGLPFLALAFCFVAPMNAVRFGLPVLFRQWRLGRDRKPFRLHKFRSMRILSGSRKGEKDETHLRYLLTLLNEEASLPWNDGGGERPERRARKLRNRQESDFWGTILRKSSVDELPQLINVLQGQMSLVGPRPALDYEVDLYPSWSLQRFQGPQGLTGLWQVSGRSVLPLHTALFMDGYYTLEYNFLMDFRILFGTARTLFSFSQVF